MAMQPESVDAAHPFTSGAVSDQPHLDLRGCAIEVCAAWDAALRHVSKTEVTRRGLLRRQVLVIAARALEADALRPRPQWSGVAENMDMVAGRLAVVDWIAYTVAMGPRRLNRQTALSYSRFYWGYVESTELFAFFFDQRKRCGSVRPVPDTSFGRTGEAPPNEGICFMGFYYGAPTFGALVDPNRGSRGRGRYMRQIGLNDQVWQVLEKNRTGHEFVALDRSIFNQSAMLECKPGAHIISDEVAALVSRMLASVVATSIGGPQFIVARSDGVRMRLSLRLARQPGASCVRPKTDDASWRNSRGGLFRAVEDFCAINFIAKTASAGTSTEWGSCERLYWHLERVEPRARKHADLFVDKAPFVVHQSNAETMS